MLKAKRISSSSCPLLSLTAAVLDTETTSLDVRKARILEIGAVGLLDGRLAKDEVLSTYVNPGEKIPLDFASHPRHHR